MVDDGSTDGGHFLLSDYPEIRLVRQPNAGEAAARNRGILESTQPTIAFLDQDDLWLRPKLTLQLRALEADPSVDIVSGSIESLSRTISETNRARVQGNLAAGN